MKIELKPCPFCGGVAELREYKEAHPFSDGETNIFFVICTNCGCSSLHKMKENIYYKENSKEIKQGLKMEVAELWNRRFGDSNAD